MFDLMKQMMVQLIECLPAIIGLYLIFKLTGDLLFKE